jgi:NitT/TauT family transport system substrate-binding protein
MFKGIYRRLPVAFVSAAAVFVGPNAMSQPTTGLVPIQYATSFGSFGRESYAYVALELGYFKEAGFDVTIRPGTGSVAGLQLIGAGKIDFAPIDTAALTLARANEGARIKLVSMVHQSSLLATIGLKESGLSKPKDLEGGLIADSPGSVIQALFPLFAEGAGIDASKVKFVPATPQTLPSLLVSKQVKAVNQLMVGMPLMQKAAQGKELIAFPYAEYVPGMLGNGIVTTEERIGRNAGEVRRFVAALNKGLATALDRPEDAARILQKHVPLADPAIATEELRIMARYVNTDLTKRCGLGYIDGQRVAATVAIVKKYLSPKGDVQATDLYAPGFVATSCK